jgi:hypothetical protein
MALPEMILVRDTALPYRANPTSGGIYLADALPRYRPVYKSS